VRTLLRCLSSVSFGFAFEFFGSFSHFPVNLKKKQTNHHQTHSLEINPATSSLNKFAHGSSAGKSEQLRSGWGVLGLEDEGMRRQ
jgi:hypothetical protein